MGVTIRDIARACNVSTSTVSGVLHNKNNVREETRKLVMEAIKKLKYDPYKNIPLAKHKKTRTLGMVLPKAAFTVQVIG